ncbi:hypothetical protein CDL15_Pgr005417 [Punica granatum]|uniref:LOB domain-containing protein n=1 Tax=Punica granatum TaxID=22663 RepID=A0A218XDJ1_PUNGR|nr:hypothetical protein CDL15_Pgr005417 [Punica granatum]
MRMSCNGCRVLRKGCGDGCPIRHCLRWIKTSQSQANATIFLAKFYGRAGLINLLNAGPDPLRHDVFKSLLYEACGRIINPIYGSTGLLWTGSWQLCQDAVESVLNGVPITRIPDDSALAGSGPPLQACDIRHVSKPNKGSSIRLHRVRSRGGFKRRPATKLAQAESVSRESELSQGPIRCSESDAVSAETEEASTSQLDERAPAMEDGLELELELTLGFDRTAKRACSEGKRTSGDGSEAEKCQLRVGL